MGSCSDSEAATAMSERLNALGAKPDILRKITKETKKVEDWRLRFFDGINGIYRIY
jgi:hypothetical protein